jgi:hypothetical protein
MLLSLTIPCIMPLENCVGEKISTVLLKMTAKSISSTVPPEALQDLLPIIKIYSIQESQALCLVPSNEGCLGTQKVYFGIQNYLRTRGYLYAYFQQGWESLNERSKLSFFNHTQRRNSGKEQQKMRGLT